MVQKSFKYYDSDVNLEKVSCHLLYNFSFVFIKLGTNGCCFHSTILLICQSPPLFSKPPLRRILSFFTTYKDQSLSKCQKSKVKTKMGSAQPLALTPALTLINRQTSTRFLHIKNLHCFTPKTWSRNADSSSDHRFPFLSYSISPPLHPSFPLCSRFPLPRPPLPSLFPLGFHPLRPFLMSSMPTPRAAATDSSQPSETKTVSLSFSLFTK